MDLLRERIAIVTGGANGIGMAIAVRLAENGCAVAILDVNEENARRCVNHICANGGQALAITGDVANDAQAREAVEKTADRFGGLDVLVNNAGINPVTPLEDLSLAEWNRVLSVNLTGCFLMVKAALPYLKRAGPRGRVIGIASLAGQIGGIAVGLHYTASKGGVIAFTKQLAKLLAPFKATANSIAPTTTNTDMVKGWPDETKASLVSMIPLKRLCEPMDIAEAVLFLASDRASFITGETLNVNGGMYMG